MFDCSICSEPMLYMTATDHRCADTEISVTVPITHTADHYYCPCNPEDRVIFVHDISLEQSEET